MTKTSKKQFGDKVAPDPGPGNSGADANDAPLDPPALAGAHLSPTRNRRPTKPQLPQVAMFPPTTVQETRAPLPRRRMTAAMVRTHQRLRYYRRHHHGRLHLRLTVLMTEVDRLGNFDRFAKAGD